LFLIFVSKLLLISPAWGLGPPLHIYSTLIMRENFAKEGRFDPPMAESRRRKVSMERELSEKKGSTFFDQKFPHLMQTTSSSTVFHDRLSRMFSNDIKGSE